MSAEAIAFVAKYAPQSKISGNALCALFTMALRSKDRNAPFLIEISAKDLATAISVTPRYAQRLLSDMMTAGLIQRVAKGEGRQPNAYQFGRVDTSYRTVQATSPSSYLREDSTEVA